MRTRLGDLCAQARAYALRSGSPADREARRAYAWAHVGVSTPPAPAGGPGYRIVNADKRAKLYIYDYIDMWGVNAQDFARELDDVDAPAIDLHINSPGGSVWDAYAIYQALRAHPATITTHIDGVAASAASFIAMAADPGEILIAKPARVMIHDASGVTVGNAADHRAQAELLDGISQDIAQIYADRAGGSADMWRAAMQANAGMGTWYSSVEALDSKLADRLDDPHGGSDGGDGSDSNGSPDGEPSDDVRSRLIRARHSVTLGGVK